MNKNKFDAKYNCTFLCPFSILYEKARRALCVQKQISRKKTILLERIALINKIKKVLLQKRRRRRRICVLYTLWSGWGSLSTFMRPRLQCPLVARLDDTKDVVLFVNFFATVLLCQKPTTNVKAHYMRIANKGPMLAHIMCRLLPFQIMF